VLAKADPKSLHPSWAALLPSSDAAANRRPFGTPSLAHVLLHDPSPRARHAAAATLATLLEGPAQRAYLAVAEATSMERQPVRGFMSLSQSLGQAALHLHKALHCCLSDEQDPATLSAALRALGTLCLGTPYDRMPIELLPATVAAVEGRFRRASLGLDPKDLPHDALPLVSASLGCLAAALGARGAPSPGLADALAANGLGERIVAALLAYAAEDVQEALRLEALMALRGAAQQHTGLIALSWGQVLQLAAAGAKAAASTVFEATGAAPGENGIFPFL
jgi:hypothetical protein